MGYYINQNSKGEALPATGKAKMLIEDGATVVTPPRMATQPYMCY
jgi:hypothetical protein